MKLSNITPQKITSSKIVVDEPSIFLTFPDTNIKIYEQIYQTNFILSNCEAIISPGKMIKFMRKSYNGKTQSLNLKKKIIELDQVTKKLKVVNSLNSMDNKENKKEVNKYYFYDMSIYSDAIKNLSGKFQPRILAEQLISEASKTYQQIKSNYPNYAIDLLFLIKDDKGFVWPMLDNIRMWLPQDALNEYIFFDKFCYVSTNNKYLIPVLSRMDGKNYYIVQNINKLPGYFVEDEVVEPTQIVAPDQQPTETPVQNSETPTQDLAPKEEEQIDKIKEISLGLTKKLDVSTNVDEDGEIKVEVNTKQLKKILDKYDIDDPAILSNVKVAIDKYLTKHQESKEAMSREQAELMVFKAINKTVHGTEEIKERYLHDPKLLFDKLKKTTTYRVPLQFPNYKNELVQPKDIVDLDYTCGQHRQKFEFSDAVHQNVEKLFRTLEESSEYPVKIKKIDHEIIDTDSDRFIQYTVTVQNLNGGYDKPYQIKFNIPGLVSDRYFKLKNSHYVMQTQQFMKPLTKTDSNEVRLLSNYAIVRVRLENFRFNSANIRDLTDYIKLKYPKFIKEENEDQLILFDGDIIGIAGNHVYSSADGNKVVQIDPDLNILVDQAGKKINVTKYEYQLDILFNKLKQVNRNESLSKSKLKVPYLEIYLGGIKIPLILYLWSQKGLLTALNDESIQYNLTEIEPDQKAGYHIKTGKNQYLNIYPNDFRQTCFVNGLISLQTVLKDRIVENINNPESSYDIITQLTNSSGKIRMITLMTENEIDPITKDLLEFEGNSTNFVKIVSKDMIDLLFKKDPDDLADLAIYRSRLSEIIFQLLYKQIKQAHNHYRNKVFTYEDKEAKIELFEDFVTQSLVTKANVLQNTEPFNPVEEIALASRVVKSGIGGVPSKFSFKVSHRNIHPSNYGNISAAGTSESADVGLVTHHTMTPSIINQYGAYGIREIDGLKPWELLSLDESLTPMQSSMDSDRLVMARTHATQTVPVENSEIPLVITGAEHITGQITSTRFIHRAKQGGKVLDIVPNKYITVKYDNNIVENLDIIPRRSRTKRGSFIQLEMNNLSIGELFNKNDLIAWTKNFNQGIYSSGKNVCVCFMNYMGYCHEDSYTITEDLAAKITRTLIKPISVIIPPNAKVLNILEEINQPIKTTDILLEFTYDLDLESYLQNQSNNFDEEDLERLLISQSEKSIKTHAGFNGTLVGMKIFLNTKKDMDPKLIKLHQKLVKQDQEVIAKLEENKTNEDRYSSIDNLDIGYFKIGGHKLKGGTDFIGAKIEFYIKEEHSLELGDKITNRFGSKGVISKLIEKDLEPVSETGLKPEVFISPISIFSRKNIPFLKEIYIGKIFHFLQQQCSEMASDPKISNDKIVKKILSVYQLLATKKVYDQIENQLNSIKPNQLRNSLKDSSLQLRLIIEPFENVEMQDIKHAAELIDIPLDEKVFIPELNAYTDVPVPVGFGYYLSLEHISEDFANIRGADVYTSLTRQPTKGKQKSGGQSISGQDIYALLSLNADNILNELLTIRSDDHINKRKVYMNILNTGELANIPQDTGEGGTSKLFNLYIRGLGLEIT
jgi:DNA-directed RNA polymerase beta subunit